MATKSRTLKQAFADRLAELKREKGYTVASFAGAIGPKGLKINTVRDWLNARVLPRAEPLHAIAKHFGVTTDWLLGIDGAPKYPTQWRADGALAHDVAAYTAREALATIGTNDEEARELLPRLVNGETLLRRLVKDVADDMRAEAIYISGWRAAAPVLAETLSKVTAGQQDAKGGVQAILRCVYEMAPLPTPKIIEWPLRPTEQPQVSARRLPPL
jgi:transcriptional regulator with XRE-family HTH domain